MCLIYSSLSARFRQESTVLSLIPLPETPLNRQEADTFFTFFHFLEKQQKRAEKTLSSLNRQERGRRDGTTSHFLDGKQQKRQFFPFSIPAKTGRKPNIPSFSSLSGRIDQFFTFLTVLHKTVDIRQGTGQHFPARRAEKCRNDGLIWSTSTTVFTSGMGNPALLRCLSEMHSVSEGDDARRSVGGSMNGVEQFCTSGPARAGDLQHSEHSRTLIDRWRAVCASSCWRC